MKDSRPRLDFIWLVSSESRDDSLLPASLQNGDIGVGIPGRRGNSEDARAELEMGRCDEERVSLLQINTTVQHYTRLFPIKFLSSTECNPVVPALLTTLVFSFLRYRSLTSSTRSRDLFSNLIRKAFPFHFSSNHDSITTPSTPLIPLLQLPRGPRTNTMSTSKAL